MTHKSDEEVVKDFHTNFIYNEIDCEFFSNVTVREVDSWIIKALSQARKDTEERVREEIRGVAEVATDGMLQSLKTDRLDGDERYEWYGYIRGVRDMVYTLNCQQNGKSKTNDDLQEALKLLPINNNNV